MSTLPKAIENKQIASGVVNAIKFSVEDKHRQSLKYIGNVCARIKGSLRKLEKKNVYEYTTRLPLQSNFRVFQEANVYENNERLKLAQNGYKISLYVVKQNSLYEEEVKYSEIKNSKKLLKKEHVIVDKLTDKPSDRSSDRIVVHSIEDEAQTTSQKESQECQGEDEVKESPHVRGREKKYFLTFNEHIVQEVRLFIQKDRAENEFKHNHYLDIRYINKFQHTMGFSKEKQVIIYYEKEGESVKLAFDRNSFSSIESDPLENSIKLPKLDPKTHIEDIVSILYTDLMKDCPQHGV